MDSIRSAESTGRLRAYGRELAELDRLEDLTAQAQDARTAAIDRLFDSVAADPVREVDPLIIGRFAEEGRKEKEESLKRQARIQELKKLFPAERDTTGVPMSLLRLGGTFPPYHKKEPQDLTSKISHWCAEFFAQLPSWKEVDRIVDYIPTFSFITNMMKIIYKIKCLLDSYDQDTKTSQQRSIEAQDLIAYNPGLADNPQTLQAALAFARSVHKTTNTRFMYWSFNPDVGRSERVQRELFIPKAECLGPEEEDSKDISLRAHILDQSFSRCILLLVPVLGNIVVFIMDTYQAVLLKEMQEVNGLLLEHAGAKAQDDDEMVLKAVQRHGCALQFASERLKKNVEIVEAAIRQDCLASRYVEPEILNEWPLRSVLESERVRQAPIMREKEWRAAIAEMERKRKQDEYYEDCRVFFESTLRSFPNIFAILEAANDFYESRRLAGLPDRYQQVASPEEWLI